MDILKKMPGKGQFTILWKYGGKVWSNNFKWKNDQLMICVGDEGISWEPAPHFYTSGGFPTIHQTDVIYITNKRVVKIVVKKASEIAKWMEENDYVVDTQGVWASSITTSAALFLPEMWTCCGKEVSKCQRWKFLNEWIEEVEVEDDDEDYD